MTGPNSLTLNDGKAGMEGLDKDKINRIIREASKGSKFYHHTEKKEKELQDKVQTLLEERKSITDVMIRQRELELDGLIEQLEMSRDLTRDIVHIDMDAFYAAVEMRDNPYLKDVPMAVGSNSMLSTSNYLARKYGVRAAMPGFIAKKLCPSLVIVEGNHAKYSQVSAKIMGVIQKFTEKYSAGSLDEVYIDLTGLVRAKMRSRDTCPRHVTPEEEAELACWCTRESAVYNLVTEIRSAIFNETQLTASAGISSNTFLAKVCSDLNKPNGQYQLHPNRESILDFVADLPIKKVPGIGRVQQALLDSLGVTLVSDLMTHRGIISHLFSPGAAYFYISTALGIASNTISSGDEGRVSMSTENTFTTALSVNTGHHLTSGILSMLADLCETLAGRLAAENLAGETISVKLKLATFEILQKSKTVSRGLSTKMDLEAMSRDLLSALVRDRIKDSPNLVISARLLGVRVHKFMTTRNQASIRSFIKPDTAKISSPEKTTTWSCPVCHALLPQKTMMFNKHLDQCVGEQASSSKHASKPANQRCRKSSGEEVNKTGKGKKRRVTGEILEVESGKNDWECPICFKKISSDVTVVNVHLDRCLKSTSTRTEPETPKERKKKLEGASPRCSLLRYFKTS